MGVRAIEDIGMFYDNGADWSELDSMLATVPILDPKRICLRGWFPDENAWVTLTEEEATHYAELALSLL